MLLYLADERICEQERWQQEEGGRVFPIKRAKQSYFNTELQENVTKPESFWKIIKKFFQLSINATQLLTHSKLTKFKQLTNLEFLRNSAGSFLQSLQG